MPSRYNPVRGVVLAVGALLQRFGLVDGDRADRAADLSWPRIVTGIARMSKNAVDVAMVGVAVGPLAIAGVGFAVPFWGLTFSIGSGIAAGSIALVSQRFGADQHERIGGPVRHSVTFVLAVTLPLFAGFYLFAEPLIGLLSDDPTTVGYGATYLRVVSFGVPFAALNLIGSRVYIGVDDAWTPMVVRAGGAVANVVLNALFVFGLGMGVAGAALGTVVANVLVTAAFVVGLTVRRLPGTRSFPAIVSPRGRYLGRETLSELVSIGVPVIGRNSARTVARFPMLAIVALFGPIVVAAYVVARRVWGILNTPGWGFGLAASSLVGQALGADDEAGAAAYAREITLVAVGTYLVGAALTAVFAEQIVRLFVADPGDPSIPVGTFLVLAVCVSIVPQAVKSTIAGALDATGDTRWPFYSQVVGVVGLALPVAYLGATTSLGLWGLALAFVVETTVPAAINYYRFRTGKWRAISREYRPEAPADD